jgi:HSP20 family protein
MTLEKTNGSILNQLPMLFDDFFNKDFSSFALPYSSRCNKSIPVVNIKETAEKYQVEVAAPGMTKKDFKIELEGNRLTISSGKTKEPGNDEEKYFRKEFSYQSFSRTFNLQKEVVDLDKIRASYVDGVLQLLIPKKEEAKQKPARLIQIS